MNYIYLHGFASSENSYKGTYLRERFAEIGQTLLTPDLNGVDFTHMTLSSQLAIVRKLMKTLSGDIALLGSSMGGYLSAILAEREPRIKRLVLLAPAFQFVTRYARRISPTEMKQWRKKGYLAVFHFGYNALQPLHHGIIADARKYDRLPLQRHLPTLVIHGRHDDTVPYQLSIDYLDLNPEAHLLLLNTDHGMGDAVETIWRYVHMALFVPSADHK